MNYKLIISTVLLMFFVFTSQVFAQEDVNVVSAQEETVVEKSEEIKEEKETSNVKYIAAALAVGLSCLAGGMAVGKIGSAAMGAMSENPEVSGKALPFVGLAEGICLWGFLVGLLIIIL